MQTPTPRWFGSVAIALSLAVSIAVSIAFVRQRAELIAARAGSERRAPSVPARHPLRRVDASARCEPVEYAGPETPLYSDRVYHTQQRVAALAGQVFCRGARHGSALWLLDVRERTTVHAIASDAYGLEDVGWQPVAEPVSVAAAGISFDRLYALPLQPGRHLLHYGHVATAIPVFWDPEAARIVALPAADAPNR